MAYVIKIKRKKGRKRFKLKTNIQIITFLKNKIKIKRGSLEVHQVKNRRKRKEIIIKIKFLFFLNGF